MIEFIRQHRRLFVLLTLAGVALRLFFIIVFPITQGDTLVYADIAKNWLDHHTFAQTIDGQPEPTLIRLPGYPAFLAVCFKLFGSDFFGAVRILQLLMDLAACLFVSDLARRSIGERAALWAVGLAVLCPFTANYVALALAEAPSILLTVLAFWFAMRGMDSGLWREWVGCGAASALAILMRPDNALVPVVICGYVLVRILIFQSKIKHQKSEIRDAVLAVVLVGAVSLAPLVPWAFRNWRVFHVFQPLAARYANNPDEDPHLGFQQWTKTWMGEYVSVVEVYWHVTGEEVDAKLLPSRAFDSAEEREKTVELFTAYNDDGNTLPADLDARFGELARERKQRRPLRYYVWLPSARIADMWLRPRTEMIGIMERWWEYWNDPVDFTKALLYGLLNMAYVSVALIGMVWGRRDVRYAGMLIAFVVVRSLFLGTLENPEPRYTLEMFPVVFVFAAAVLARVRQSRMVTSGA